MSEGHLQGTRAMRAGRHRHLGRVSRAWRTYRADKGSARLPVHCRQQERTFLNARLSTGDAGDEGGASEAWLRSLMSLLVQHPPHNYSFGPQEDLFVQVPPFPPPLSG